jgi:cytochrome c oxidase assembly protein subunit 15
MSQPTNRFYLGVTCIALVLSILMSVISAWIRLSDAGFGCEPWPDCYGQAVIIDTQPGITIAPDDTNRGLRGLHRLMASVFGIIVLIMGVMSIWYRKRFIVGTGWTVFAVAITILLALVGLNTPDIHRPIITLTNMLGGLVLASVLFHLALIQAKPPQPSVPLEAKAIFATLIITLILIASGAWVSANYAATACGNVFSCEPKIEASLAEAFDPLRELTVTEGAIRTDAASTLMLYLHQASGPITAFLVIGCAVAIFARRGYSHWVAAPTVFLVMLATATLIEIYVPSLFLASLHNTLSLALVFSLVFQANEMRRHD